MFRKNSYSSFAVDGPFNGLLFHVLLVVWDDILRNTSTKPVYPQTVL